MGLKHRRHTVPFTLAAAAAALASPAPAQSVPTSTVTFQQGINGYAGTFDMRVGSPGASRAGEVAELGSAVSGAEYFVDGFQPDGTDANSIPDSPDEQALIRFDDIIGAGPGQIPLGAFILDARLTLTTGTRSANARSPGPWGVAGLDQAFNASSTYSSFGAYGPSLHTGSATRPVGFLDDPTAGQIEPGVRVLASIAPLVQAWASGNPNHGLTIQGGRHTDDTVGVITSDGWQIATASHATIENRPKLEVTYTTLPTQTVSFQQGVNGYSGSRSAWVQMNNATTDGGTIDKAYVDGFDGASSFDDQAMVGFGNVFVSQGGLVPDDARILRAYLVLTTSDDANSRTGSPFAVHQMLKEWDATRLYTEYGDFGPSVASGDIGATPADVRYGMTSYGEAWFDVTDVLGNWQDGQANYGFNVRAADGTTDGWSFHFTGALDPSVRPELIVTYAAVPEPGTLGLIGAVAFFFMRRRRQA